MGTRKTTVAPWIYSPPQTSGAKEAQDAGFQASPEQAAASKSQVALLTGGGDKPYALGLVEALAAHGAILDFIGSDQLDCPQLRNRPEIRFFNFRGDQRCDAGLGEKATRILKYYWRLFRYAATAKPPIFHVLWNDRFQLLDRTVVMLYYKLLGRRLVFTAHNVNAGKRDSKDTLLNRLSLRIQYRLCDHIFVHTQKMKQELLAEFSVPEEKATVIPFGINNTVPTTSLTCGQAREVLGLSQGAKVLLFFGRIAPYKGLDYLIAAVSELVKRDENYRLIIAGPIKDCREYWEAIQAGVAYRGSREQIIERIEFIPDEKVEIYFKAADVGILPYTDIFQSGVLFLSYSFGLPVIATDVGSFREDIVEGETGFVCRPRDAADLARAIEFYFNSELFKNLEVRRSAIRDYANERYSWAEVGEATMKVYVRLLAD
ncbi:MAG TPA: glycosyltransferase family 4 protein [Candidatus Acidoferrum sp.]|nr:glycosyltransferase family 4 protein [Candidatus Acidoferrum sp.]